MRRISRVLRVALPIFAVLSQVPSGLAADNLARRRVLIGFNSTEARADVVYAAGAEVNHSFHLLPVVSAFLADDAIEKLRARPDIAYVEDDIQVYAVEQPIPWGVDRIDADLVWGVVHGNAGAGADVAILDTGIDGDHPDLKVAGGVNYVGGLLKDGSIKAADWDDKEGHGTHCAGIVAAVRNDIGTVGIAPEATLWAVKVLSDDSSGYVSDVIQGLEWCVDHGIEVASMSFAGGHSQSLERACESAANANVLLVAATGNDGGPVHYPAAYASVIAVSAIDSAGNFPSFCNSGPETELTAPGVNIYSTTKDGGYATLSGTSMACPHVAGVAALVWASSELGLSSAMGVRARLRETAEDLIGLEPDQQGYGLVDADKAVGSQSPVLDIAIADVFAPRSVVQDNTVEVTVTVRNVGNRDVTSDIEVTLVSKDLTAALLSFRDDVTNIQTISGGLTAGASESLTYAWQATDVPAGDHMLTASHAIVDDDATNNALSAYIAVESTLTDIAITTVEAPDSAIQGDTVEVAVVVENQGNQDVTRYMQVTLVCDNATPGDTFDDTTLGIQTATRGLAAGASATFTYAWRVAGGSQGAHTLVASHKTPDDNAENNTLDTTVHVSTPHVELVVTRINPYVVRAGTPASAIINGSGFVEGARVTFENGDGPTPTASGIVVSSSNTIFARVVAERTDPLIPMIWDVRVTSPDGSSAVLRQAFTVRP